jgi:zinc protease
MNRAILLAAALTAAASGALTTHAAGAQATTTPLDRSKPPVLPATPALRVPPIVMRTLSNGIPVAVIEDHEIPIVRVSALVDASGLLDPADKDGLSSLTFAMLSEGTTTRTADQLADAFAELGTTVSPTGFLTLTSNLPRALDLMRDQLWNPAFPQASLDRIRANRIADLRRLKDQPQYIASRVMANALWGHDHPYERSATEADLTAITRDDLVAFHADYFRPQNVKLIVAGDVTPTSAVAALERAFGAWPRGGKTAAYAIPTPPAPAATTIYLFDRPNSAQSAIMVGTVGPTRDTPEYYALDVANAALGGTFNSRINLNLRERHGYTYGASSFFQYRRPPQPGQFAASTLVATTKTDSALIEMMGELRGFGRDRPLTPEEFAQAQASTIRSLPLNFESAAQVAGAAATILDYTLPLDYYARLTSNYLGVTPATASEAATRHLDPAHLAIVIVGDRRAIEGPLRAANIAPIVVVDENARPVAGAAGGGGR